MSGLHDSVLRCHDPPLGHRRLHWRLQSFECKLNDIAPARASPCTHRHRSVPIETRARHVPRNPPVGRPPWVHHGKSAAGRHRRLDRAVEAHAVIRSRPSPNSARSRNRLPTFRLRYRPPRWSIRSMVQPIRLLPCSRPRPTGFAETTACGSPCVRGVDAFGALPATGRHSRQQFAPRCVSNERTGSARSAPTAA